MTFLRQKIVFDTQIISNVQSGTICSADWSAVLKYISTRCKYAISLNTLYELLAALANGSEQYFEANQERIKILYSPRGREFLPLVGDFVRSRVFGLSARRREFAPGQLKVCVEVVLAATSKSDLQNGRVRITRPGHSNKSYGFDLSLLMSQITEGKNHHARRLEQLRGGDLLRSTASTWTDAALNLMGIPETDRNAEKLLAALDAARRYDFSLYDLAKNNQYDFGRHNSDWIDSQQLYYLADPSVRIVTDDTKIQPRIQTSTQRDQLLTFDSLKKLALS